MTYMKHDVLKQFASLKKSLEQEKAQLIARLRKIEEALNDSTSTEPSLTSARASKKGRKKAKNPMSLKKAVIKVLGKNSMSKPEILSGVKKIGYQFTGKDPMNSLSVLLYSNKSLFKNYGGKFGLKKKCDS